MKYNVLRIMLGTVLSLLLIGTVSASAIEYDWPTDNHKIAQNFKLSTTPQKKYEHGGIDIGVNGVNVYASADGEVYEVYTGCTNNNGATWKSCELAGKCAPSAEGNCNPRSDYFNGYCNDGFGNGVIIRHNDGSYSAYAHLKSVNVKFGDSVSKGDIIGVSGSSGYSYGAHLHFTIVAPTKLGYWGAYNSGNAVNPLPLINGQASGDNGNKEIKITITVDEKQSANVKTTSADTITETSAILRGSFTTTGGRATECGMLLGTSESNMTKLGSDKVNTYGTSMFYSTVKYGRTLEPGTTYYYQAYAVASGKEYRGTVKSFRTEGIQPSISITTRSFCIKDDREPIQLTANTEPYGASVTWSSSDNSVVYVYESTGKIVGVAPGTATITAEMEYNGRNYYASCDVTVLPREVNPDITLNAENVNIEEKTYTLLMATTTPNGETVKWESSDSSVATVDDAGFVSGVSAGTATISASFEYNGHTYTAYCAVTVEPVQDNSLKVPVLSLSSSQIKEGENFTAYWTEAAADASYYIDYSGRTAGGSSEFGMSRSTKSLSMSTGSFWNAGTYTLCIVASNSTGSVRSNEVELIIQEKDNTKSGIVVNTNGQYLAINDRAAASPKYSNQIGRIPPAGVVTVYPDKASGNWYYVEYNGVSGYAYGKYISLQ